MVLMLLIAPGAWAQARSSAQRMTATPEHDVLARADEPEQGLVEFDCSKCSAMTDLLFVAARETCGNAGCDYYIFRKSQNNSYEYLTTTFMNSGFQFLKTKHHGMNDMLSCFHVDASECSLIRYEFDGTTYQERSREPIASSELYSRMPAPENVAQVYLSKDLKKTSP